MGRGNQRPGRLSRFTAAMTATATAAMIRAVTTRCTGYIDSTIHRAARIRSMGHYDSTPTDESVHTNVLRGRDARHSY